MGNAGTRSGGGCTSSSLPSLLYTPPCPASPRRWDAEACRHNVALGSLQTGEACEAVCSMQKAAIIITSAELCEVGMAAIHVHALLRPAVECCWQYMWFLRAQPA